MHWNTGTEMEVFCTVLCWETGDRLVLAEEGVEAFHRTISCVLWIFHCETHRNNCSSLDHRYRQRGFWLLLMAQLSGQWSRQRHHERSTQSTVRSDRCRTSWRRSGEKRTGSCCTSGVDRKWKLRCCSWSGTSGLEALRRSVFGGSKGITFIVITLSVELNSWCQSKKRSQTPLRYLDVVWGRNITLDVLQDSRVNGESLRGCSPCGTKTVQRFPYRNW